MPDNAQAPEQTQAGTTAEAAATPDNDKPLTRKDIEEIFGGFRETISKEVQGVKSLSDRRYNQLQIALQQQQSRAVRGVETDDGGEQVGYDFGSDADRAYARAALKEVYPGFDYSKIEERLNDQNTAPRYLRLKQDGRTFDWYGIMEGAWRDHKEQLADELLAKQAQAQAEADAKRDESKKAAIISGASASYPEGVRVPETREDAQNLSNKELVESMLAQGFPRENLTPQMQEWLKEK